MTIEQVFEYYLKDCELKSKAYYKLEYYLGQALAIYGEQYMIEKCLKNMAM